MISVCKRFEFCYGHRLPGYDGKCRFQHGHNSVVEVEVAGRDPSSYQCMVMDFGALKLTVGSILEELDHQDITDKFQGMPPVAEVICSWLTERISQKLPEGVRLIRLRVTETPNSWAEWKKG